MKKLFMFTRRKKSIDAPDSASIVNTANDIRENEMGKFHKAAWQGDVDKLEQLVKTVDINLYDKQNRTALHLACARGNVAVVEFLIEKKAKINLGDNQNKTPLMKAVQEQHDACANILLKNKADPNQLDSDENTALHLASSTPSISTVILLVKHGADVNAKNRKGFSPLTVAVQENHREVAEFLLKKGADVNILDRYQRSPLMIAAGNGHLDMMKLLLKFKANTELKDNEGHSAEDYVDVEHHNSCSALLTEHRRKHGIQVQSSLRKARSKSLDRISSKDAVENVARASCTGANKEGPKQMESDMSQLLKFLAQMEKERNDIEEAVSEWDKTSDASKRTTHAVSVASQMSEAGSSYSVELREIEVHLKTSRKSIADVKPLSPLPKCHSKKLSERSPYTSIMASNQNLPVNDDTLSDGSDNDGRSQPKQKLQKQHIDDMEISEETDALTSSSDGVLDEDNPFKMKLDNIMSQQNIKHPILKPNDHQGYADKVTKLKEEKAQLNNKMEVKDGQCVMEHKLMQRGKDLSNLRSSSNQQKEDSLNKTSMAHVNITRLEEELRQTRAQLARERCTNAQLQQKLKGQDFKQHTMEKDYKITQARSVMEWNNVVTGLKYDVRLANDRLATQCQANSVLEAKTQDLSSRLAEAEQVREKALLQVKEEKQRVKDKLASETASLQEAFSQKLSKLKAYASSMEKKVEKVEAQLMEKDEENATLQHEIDQMNARVKELEELLWAEKDLVSWASARPEATQELLSKAESETMLDECVVKETAVTDTQQCFTDILSKLRSDCADKVKLMQDKNQDLEAKGDELRKHIHRLQEEKNQRETSQKKLQAKLADLLKKLSKCDEMLAFHKRYRHDYEEEKARLHKEVDKMGEDVKQLEEVVHRQQAVLKDAKRRLRDHQAREIETQKHAIQYRREVEEKARQEIQKKIHEINLFLKSQAVKYEAQNQTKTTTEVSLRSMIQELNGKLKLTRSTQHDTITQKDALEEELKRYRRMYRDERWQHKCLINNINRSYRQLSEDLLSKHCKSLIASATPKAQNPPSCGYSTEQQCG
ncbi:uncharacterized protein LOC144015900 [Festucalex cinctus]